MSFDDDLNAAVKGEREFRDVDVLVGKKLHTLRFRQIDGLLWAAHADKNPARPDVLVDARYGYNLRGIVMSVAPISGVRLEGDKEVELTAEQWKKLFKSLDGAGFQRVSDAVWDLNEYTPGQQVEAAKKALSGSKKK